MSSLVFLGLSLLTFVMVYGVAFVLMPMVLGSFYTAIDPTVIITNETWLDMYNINEDNVKYLVPLMPSFGILFIVIKVLLVSSARGRE